MTQTADSELYRRASSLLEPGEIELHGAVIHTGYSNDEESLLHQATLDIGQLVSEQTEAGETYVYSGNDDPEFGVNQHQGLTIQGDEFVWECQQLFRGQQYDVVIYWEAADAHREILSGIEELGFDATGITDAGVLEPTEN